MQYWRLEQSFRPGCRADESCVCASLPNTPREGQAVDQMKGSRIMRPIAINVGCGQTPTREWINYDNSPSIVLARKSLSKLLVNEGYVDPVVLPAGQTTIAEPGNLDLFERHEESVYIEARRPASLAPE